MSYPPPLYDGESGQVSAHVVRAGIEPAVVYPNGNKVFYLAQGTETQGTFGLYRSDRVKVHAGDFAHVPAGGVHGFRNEDGAAKMLLHFAPGAPREAYFEGLAEGMGTLDGDAYDRFMREHDNTWL